MKVKLLKQLEIAKDGINVELFQKGETVDVRERCAKGLVKAGLATDVKPTPTKTKEEKEAEAKQKLEDKMIEEFGINPDKRKSLADLKKEYKMLKKEAENKMVKEEPENKSDKKAKRKAKRKARDSK